MIIYKITNKINNKLYIGQTRQKLKERWRQHCKAKTGALQFAIKKYNKENFTVEQIDSAQTIEELNEKEIYWIHFYNSFNTGYNCNSGGKSYIMSEDHKKKISEARKTIDYNNIKVDYSYMKSQEYRQLKSKQMKEKMKDPEFANKIKNNLAKGNKVEITEERRNKLRENGRKGGLMRKQKD